MCAFFCLAVPSIHTNGFVFSFDRSIFGSLCRVLNSAVYIKAIICCCLSIKKKSLSIHTNSWILCMKEREKNDIHNIASVLMIDLFAGPAALE